MLHCHDLVQHKGSPVRCLLLLHCFIVVIVLVLFACEENVIVWLLLCGRFRVKLRGSV